MKIYIITSGSYSDYSIDAVFMSAKKAKAYLDHQNTLSSGLDCSIEEYETYDDEPLPELVTQYSASMEFYINFYRTMIPYVVDPTTQLVTTFPEDDSKVKTMLRETKTYQFDSEVEARAYTVEKSSVIDRNLDWEYLKKYLFDRFNPEALNKPDNIRVNTGTREHITAYSTKSQEVANKIVQDRIPQVIQLLEELGFKPK